MPCHLPPSRVFLAALCGAWLVLPAARAAETEWWNKEWSQRQQFTIDGAVAGAGEKDATLLLRITDGSVFAAAREDGADLRFVAADGKTVLAHSIERYDSLLGEAFVWLRMPEIAESGGSFHLYFGNAATPAPGDATEAYGPRHAAVYHFAEQGTAPADATGNGNKGDRPGAVTESAIIGPGLLLSAGQPISLSTGESLTWTADQEVSIALWIKPGTPQPNAVVLQRGTGQTSCKLLLDQGIPIVEVANGGAPVRSVAAAPLPPGSWAHLALVAEGGAVRLFVNGEPYGTAGAALPAADGPLVLGAADGGFVGEIDELRVFSEALSPAGVKFEFVNQGGSDAAARFLVAGPVEGAGGGGGSEALEHVLLFGDIARNMMFDGWIAVGVCILMIIAGWTVALKKYFYLNMIERGNNEFMRQWKQLSANLATLDHQDSTSVKSMGGNLDEDDRDMLDKSPLYHIYQIGSDEIRVRLEKLDGRMDGLPGRSIQAIRASLDTGLVHENHRLTDGLVFLTISIAGGPYVGLLGTVVGVMITFALIAKHGEVNINSIAPGIASALLATVMGLVVAIPALFIYSYLSGRIKNALSMMRVFIDEFVAKMAELHRPTTGNGNGNGDEEDEARTAQPEY